MGGILVFAEHDGGAFSQTALELIGKARELGDPVCAAVLGDAPAAELGVRAFVAAGDFASYDTGATVDALAAIVAQADPDVILAAASYAGRDALPRLAARLGTALAADCMDLRREGGELVGRRPVYAGRAFVDATLTGRPAIATVRAKSFPKPEGAGGAGEVVEVTWERTTPSLQVEETLAPQLTGIPLATADRVVAGGRSLRSEENFDRVVRGLASALGAAVGASRAATDAGYAPHSEQVGQTGQTVAPTLYIALGISGAIQHLAGMRTSKVIVAVNTDPDAPIMEHATYKIVNDLFEVAPAIAEALKS